MPMFAVKDGEIRRVKRIHPALGVNPEVRWCEFCDRSSQATLHPIRCPGCAASWIEGPEGFDGPAEGGTPDPATVETRTESSPATEVRVTVTDGDGNPVEATATHDGQAVTVNEVPPAEAWVFVPRAPTPPAESGGTPQESGGGVQETETPPEDSTADVPDDQASAVLQVVCPSCHAGRDEACRTKTGRPSAPHQGRVGVLNAPPGPF